VPAPGGAPTLFADAGRLLRTNFATWIAAAEAQLGAGESRSAERLAAAGNTMALRCVHYGQPAAAETLCRAQLDWLAVRAPSSVSGARLAIAPWINLGRLASLRGDVDEALRHFRIGPPVGEHPPVATLGPLSVTRQDWIAALAQPPDMTAAVERGAVLETLKALLRSGRYEMALFVETSELALAEALAEARVIAFAALGRHTEALAAIGPSRPGSQVARAARTVRAWPSVVALRDTAARRGVAAELATSLGETAVGEVGAQAFVSVGLAAAAILSGAGERSAAHAMYERAIAVARQTGDEPDLIAGLEGALQTAPGSAHADAYREEVSLLLQGCQYASVRRAHGLAPGQWAGSPLERLTDELLRRFDPDA
jgi:tetratricopeptide (TPR) repeat protein